ncbi:MAG: hypothetical protein IJG84_25955 [Kiritimatiellae bacterium]|nr:hypothetical protein [Kiritimatiellia bacterium]
MGICSTAIAASLISPFFVEVAPEVRSSYVSIGKLMEDRPMQITSIRVGYDADAFGRFGIRNWDVSSLTDRRHDVHRHALYHTEFGPTWQYDLELFENWTVKSDLTRSWTLYRGFKSDHASSNKTYSWWQLEQELANPYVVPFYRLRRCFRGSDYVYFKAGVRKRLTFLEDFYITPSVYAEGGNSRNYKRVAGTRPDGERWHSGVSSVTFRLELGWVFAEQMSAFVFAEQYEVVGQDTRSAIESSSNRCAHKDWTLCGVGCRIRF